MAHDLIRVLVIDDSAFSRQAITRMLETSPLVRWSASRATASRRCARRFELQPGPDHARPRDAAHGRLHVPAPGDEQAPDAGDGDQRPRRRGRRLQGARARRGRLHREADAARHAASSSTIERELLRKVHAIRELRIDKVRERLAALPSRGAAARRGAARRAARGRDRLVDGRAGGADADLRRLPRAAALRVPGRAAHARGLHARASPSASTG